LKENTVKTMLQPQTERTRTQLIIRPRQLAVEELVDLPVPTTIEEGHLVLRESLRGWRFKTPVRVPLQKVLDVREKGLIVYILRAFASERANLIPWVFENQSLVRLARHFLRHYSGSTQTFYTYVDSLSRYSRFLGHSPDFIIQDVKAGGNIVDAVRVQSHIGFLEDYLAHLQDDGLSVGRVHCTVKHVKTFYKVNGVDVKLSEPLSRRVTFRDRAPTPEELSRVLDIATLREKAIVSIMALGGFRETTLSLLQYRHVRDDLEQRRIPIAIKVEAAITKGKYHSYTTFLGAEAALYTRLYLESRRTSAPGCRTPPETLTDSSPLIRDQTAESPRPITGKQIRRVVHNLYAKAQLLKKPNGRMFDLRVHSLRKYFKTQLTALGAPPDFVEYWMGHTVDTYDDIESLGAERLRTEYANRGLAIRPKTTLSKLETVKEIIRAYGMNPEEVLAREALADGATTILDPGELENLHIELLRKELRQLVHDAESTVQRRIAISGTGGI